MRVDPAEFRKLDLRCHTLLSDVPLHDVWAIPLRNGGPGRTVRDVRALMFRDRGSRPPVAVRALFAIRSGLGRAFGWDDARHDPPEASYLHRLTEVERSRSQVLPGTREGSFRVLYLFDQEALLEARNATVHGFVALALIHCQGGYTAYMGIYVQPVSHLTALYMALIDPFRRFVVYPALGRQLQRAWLRRYVTPE